jgi:phospholipase/lecithinase/hemolysin
MIRNYFILIYLLVMSGTAIAQNSKLSGLVIFGDSLSDTGNLASVTANFPFPFFDNRISNGPVLVDYLAAELGFVAQASRHTSGTNGGDNFAIAGGNILGADTEDLESQISAFLDRENGQANSTTLYFLMMGGNDLRDIRSITDNTVAAIRIQSVAQKFESELNRLYDAGARIFLVSNVADIGQIPETLERTLSDPAISERARSYVELFNGELEEILTRFQLRRGVTLSKFDLFGELDRILNNANSLGFSQTTVGCFNAARFSFHSDCVFGTRFDRFVFFDSIHPAANTNRLASQAIIDSIPQMDVIALNVNIAPIIQLLLD